MTPNRRPSATVTTCVAVEPHVAWEVFTEEIDACWRQGPRFRSGKIGSSTIRLEPKVGGTLTETFGDPSFVIGNVVVWDERARCHERTIQGKTRVIGDRTSRAWTSDEPTVRVGT